MPGLPPSEIDRLELTETPIGTRLRIRVKAGARTNAILGVHNGALKIAVTAPPHRGKANRSVTKLLARTFDLPPTAVELIAGHTAQEKTVFLPPPPATVRASLT